MLNLRTYLALLIVIFVIYGVNIGSAIEPTLFICTSNTDSFNWNNPSYGCVLDGHPSVTSATPNIWYGRNYNIVNPYAPNTPAFIYVNVNIGGIVVGSQLLVGVSWDGGATWSANQSANGNTPPNYDDASYVLNFTASTVWNISKTTNSNFIIRVSGLSSNSIDYAQANVSYYYPAPILTYPTNVSTVNSGNINFTWTGVAPPYRLVIGEGSISNEVINTSVSGLYSLQSLSVNKTYYWKVANSDSNYSSVYSFETLLTLFTPVNASAILKSYPPLTADVNFTWAGGFDKYNIVVAKDANFNLISVDKTISNNYSLEPLEAGNYWWKVRPYNETTVSYGNYSNTFNFTLTNTQIVSGTNIQGTVYEVIAGTITPISNARVFISNNESTWSSDMVTGSNGYFLFSNLANGTYNLRATRTDLYQNSVLYYVTTMYGNTTTQNILMEKCTSSQDCYFGTIDQSIMFQSYNATTHVTSFLSGYTVNIYEGDAVVPLYTLTTDQYGVVVVRLTTGTRYRLSIHTGDGVNLIANLLDRYIYPRGEGIVITIETGTDGVITYPTNTTVTNTTERHGSTGCGISCYNSSYLTSTTGIGALGQGVLTSLVVWIVYGAGGAVTVLFTVGILAWLGIISWYMVFLFVVTGMSIYILKEM